MKIHRLVDWLLQWFIIVNVFIGLFFVDWADNSLCQNIKLDFYTLYLCHQRFQIHFNKEINAVGLQRHCFFCKLSSAVTHIINNCVAVQDAHQHLSPDIIGSTRYHAARYHGGGGGRIPHPTPLTPPARHCGLGSFMPHHNSSSGSGGAPWPLRASLLSKPSGAGLGQNPGHTLLIPRGTPRGLHTQRQGEITRSWTIKKQVRTLLLGRAQGGGWRFWRGRDSRAIKTDRSSHR